MTCKDVNLVRKISKIMSQKTTIPIWNLGSKYTRVSILQEILPSVRQTKGSYAKRSSKYLFPQTTGSQKISEPFPRDKFSVRRLPALPELCQKYFNVPKDKKQSAKKDGGSEVEVTIRLPVVRQDKIKSKTENNNVGGGAISYEDEWTFAKLCSSQGPRGCKSSAPLLKHYWNISGQDRQRIIACPQHNLMMSDGGNENQLERRWRIPANHPSIQKTSDELPPHRHIKTAQTSDSCQNVPTLVRSYTAV